MAEVSESSETEKNGTGNNNLITWLFEQGTFVPAAKLVANGDCFSIISDYLGTPMQAYDKNGDKVWEQELDIYGRQRKRPSSFIPFKYQGQYADKETGLYYNRFRYYAPRTGAYISQDPIGLMGGNPTLYGYVKDPNAIVDFYGLILFIEQLILYKNHLLIQVLVFSPRMLMQTIAFKSMWKMVN